ncbi:MAG: hypothetical protein ACJAYB_002725 [Psychromonas sp.]
MKTLGNNGGRNMIANIGNHPDKHRPLVDNMWGHGKINRHCINSPVLCGFRRKF